MTDIMHAVPFSNLIHYFSVHILSRQRETMIYFFSANHCGTLHVLYSSWGTHCVNVLYLMMPREHGLANVYCKHMCLCLKTVASLTELWVQQPLICGCERMLLVPSGQGGLYSNCTLREEEHQQFNSLSPRWHTGRFENSKVGTQSRCSHTATCMCSTVYSSNKSTTCDRSVLLEVPIFTFHLLFCGQLCFSAPQTAMWNGEIYLYR